MKDKKFNKGDKVVITIPLWKRIWLKILNGYWIPRYAIYRGFREDLMAHELVVGFWIFHVIDKYIATEDDVEAKLTYNGGIVSVDKGEIIKKSNKMLNDLLKGKNET